MTISFVKTPKVTDLGNQKKDRAKNFDYDRRRGLFFEPSSIYVSEKELEELKELKPIVLNRLGRAFGR
ncbi:MAG: hypothetical protein IJ467_02720 [Bacteroidaceae bacterium]|nr:hypothetical protein [Bacteroidaceae bacterium]